VKGDTHDSLGRCEDDISDSHGSAGFEYVVGLKNIVVEDYVVGLAMDFRISSDAEGVEGRGKRKLTALAGAGMAAR